VQKNREPRELYQNPSIVVDITKQRLKRAGHAWRHQEGLFLRMVLVNVPQGKRPLGRPRLRWGDSVQEDVGKIKLGMDWKEL